ncbi:hypothetical protein F2Q70_00022200 [Brassica cretica]|uniref:Uncharacterized protein n=1 Tax=Brassica cretica TaxID=69181 RepID=A0A8S9GMX4_BRACR|nr:hypothetical protein F2Q70_00022200 [Brassica cretica]
MIIFGNLTFIFSCEKIDRHISLRLNPVLKSQESISTTLFLQLFPKSFFDNPKRDETWVLCPRARGLCYENLDEDARFRDRRSVLAHGRDGLGAGSPRPWAR